MNGDNYITREEMFHLLKPSVVKVSNNNIHHSNEGEKSNRQLIYNCDILIIIGYKIKLNKEVKAG